MGTKAENTEKIRELEKEFSDEELAGYFKIEEKGRNGPSGPLRYKKESYAREIVVAAVLAVCVVGTFLYLISLG